MNAETSVVLSSGDGLFQSFVRCFCFLLVDLHQSVLSLCSKNVQRLEFHTDEVIAFITRNHPVNDKHKHVRKEFLTLSREFAIISWTS